MFDLVFKKSSDLIGPLLELFTHYRQNSFDKIFKKLLTTNCKNNAAFLYGILILKVKKKIILELA